MAKYELKNKQEVKGKSYSQCTIVVNFENPDKESEEKELTFEQNVILPNSSMEKAAQAYATDYEKSFNESYKEN